MADLDVGNCGKNATIRLCLLSFMIPALYQLSIGNSQSRQFISAVSRRLDVGHIGVRYKTYNSQS